MTDAADGDGSHVRRTINSFEQLSRANSSATPSPTKAAAPPTRIPGPPSPVKGSNSSPVQAETSAASVNFAAARDENWSAEVGLGTWNASISYTFAVVCIDASPAHTPKHAFRIGAPGKCSSSCKWMHLQNALRSPMGAFLWLLATPLDTEQRRAWMHET